MLYIDLILVDLTPCFEIVNDDVGFLASAMLNAEG